MRALGSETDRATRSRGESVRTSPRDDAWIEVAPATTRPTRHPHAKSAPSLKSQNIFPPAASAKSSRESNRIGSGVPSEPLASLSRASREPLASFASFASRASLLLHPPSSSSSPPFASLLLHRETESPVLSHATGEVGAESERRLASRSTPKGATGDASSRAARRPPLAFVVVVRTFVASVVVAENLGWTRSKR